MPVLQDKAWFIQAYMGRVRACTADDYYDSLEVFTLGAEYSPTEATFLRVTGTSPSDLELFELAFGLRF